MKGDSRLRKLCAQCIRRAHIAPPLLRSCGAHVLLCQRERAEHSLPPFDRVTVP